MDFEADENTIRPQCRPNRSDTKIFSYFRTSVTAWPIVRISEIRGKLYRGQGLRRRRRRWLLRERRWHRRGSRLSSRRNEVSISQSRQSSRQLIITYFNETEEMWDGDVDLKKSVIFFIFIFFISSYTDVCDVCRWARELFTRERYSQSFLKICNATKHEAYICYTRTAL